MRFHAGEVSVRNSFIFASFALIVIALYFANFFTSQPVFRSAFTEDNRTIYLTALYINLALITFFSALALFFVWGSGESLTREYWSNKLKVIDDAYSERVIIGARLDELERILPKKVCVDRIKLDVKSEEIELQVIALTDEKGEFNQVKDFNKALEESDLFGGGVRLISQERIKVQEKDVYVIMISIPVRNK